MKICVVKVKKGKIQDILFVLIAIMKFVNRNNRYKRKLKIKF